MNLAAVRASGRGRRYPHVDFKAATHQYEKDHPIGTRVGKIAIGARSVRRRKPGVKKGHQDMTDGIDQRSGPPGPKIGSRDLSVAGFISFNFSFVTRSDVFGLPIFSSPEYLQGMFQSTFQGPHRFMLRQTR